MENNIALTTSHGERVTSSYAEAYIDNSYCGSNSSSSSDTIQLNVCKSESRVGDWTSPSDLLINIIELKPPFTSKITRGKTHEGILSIGAEIVDKERARFLKLLSSLTQENASSWNFILDHEKDLVEKRVKNIYDKIFVTKYEIMLKEMSSYYETSLEEMESLLKNEVKTVLVDSYGQIIRDFNYEVKHKLLKEEKIMDEILMTRYKKEMSKIKKYYNLLLANESRTINRLVNKAIIERNDALKAFYNFLEADNLASVMYVMCSERKKCKVNKILVQKCQDNAILEKVQKLKQKQDIINSFKEKEVLISDINHEWEDKTRKIFQAFLKFISFSLKLLPEQSTFLLDFEKMVVLQLNEIMKQPTKPVSILKDEETYRNLIEFPEKKIPQPVCENQPFTVTGDFTDLLPPKYGSTETIPLDVELPLIRVERQFLYAECHKFDEIKEALETNVCKCHQEREKETEEEEVKQDDMGINKTEKQSMSESSLDSLVVEDMHRLQSCPIRACTNWSEILDFPNLDSHLDFSEENFKQVTALVDHDYPKNSSTKLINPKDKTQEEFLLSATKESNRPAATQYSSQEEFHVEDIPCPCSDEVKTKLDSKQLTAHSTVSLADLLAKRKLSLRRILQQSPNLLQAFTDEAFHFQL